MQKVYDFLKEAGTYFLATDDNGQPRVRPFGTVDIYNGQLTIQTGRKKACYRQMKANPKVEICAMKGNSWIRIAATVSMEQLQEAMDRIENMHICINNEYL